MYVSFLILFSFSLLIVGEPTKSRTLKKHTQKLLIVIKLQIIILINRSYRPI